jgi:hypothetical protein
MRFITTTENTKSTTTKLIYNGPLMNIDCRKLLLFTTTQN